MTKLVNENGTTKSVEKKQVNLLYIAKVLITDNKEIRAVANKATVSYLKLSSIFRDNIEIATRYTK